MSGLFPGIPAPPARPRSRELQRAKARIVAELAADLRRAWPAPSEWETFALTTAVGVAVDIELRVCGRRCAEIVLDSQLRIYRRLEGKLP